MNGEYRQEYLEPRCARTNLDSFLIRDRIRSALENVLPSFDGTLLDLGCGFKPYRPVIMSPACKVNSYIGLDFPDSIYGSPDLAWDGQVIPLVDDSVDTVMATELLEHCPNPGTVLAEICRVLKPGGVFFFTVPFLWPLHEIPHDYYRYTPQGLQELLSQNGFAAVEISPLGGWDASLAQMAGLWVSRRPMPDMARSILRIILWPFYLILLRIDENPGEFTSDTIFPGLSGFARKPDGRGTL